MAQRSFGGRRIYAERPRHSRPFTAGRKLFVFHCHGDPGDRRTVPPDSRHGTEHSLIRRGNVFSPVRPGAGRTGFCPALFPSLPDSRRHRGYSGKKWNFRRAAFRSCESPEHRRTASGNLNLSDLPDRAPPLPACHADLRSDDFQQPEQQHNQKNGIFRPSALSGRVQKTDSPLCPKGGSVLVPLSGACGNPFSRFWPSGLSAPLCGSSALNGLPICPSLA